MQFYVNFPGKFGEVLKGLNSAVFGAMVDL